MATVPPAFSVAIADIPRIIWADIATGDTITGAPVKAQTGLAGSVQFGGTFGGATVKLQCSNDNSTYFDMVDINGIAISATAAAIFDFSTAAAYIKPAISAGTGDAVDVTVTLRG